MVERIWKLGISVRLSLFSFLFRYERRRRLRLSPLLCYRLVPNKKYGIRCLLSYHQPRIQISRPEERFLLCYHEVLIRLSYSFLSLLNLIDKQGCHCTRSRAFLPFYFRFLWKLRFQEFQTADSGFLRSYDSNREVRKKKFYCLRRDSLFAWLTKGSKRRL